MSNKGYQNIDDEGGYEYFEGIHAAEMSVRMGFIRKVYGILLAQLGLNLLIMVPFMLDADNMRVYLVKNPGWVTGSWLAALVVLIALVCCSNNARSFPLNYILLFTFTLFEGIMLAMISVFYTTQSVILALGITMLVVLALTIFAFQTKIDFTSIGPYLFVVLLCFCLFGIFAAIFQNRILQVVYASLGVLIFSVYLVYDTQLIIGGSHKHKFGLDDYVFAALNIYLDIINLFLMILSLFGDRR